MARKRLVRRRATAGRRSLATLALGATLAALGALAPAQAFGQVIQPPFDDDYSFTDLGTPPGVPPNLGGLTLKAGTMDRLLIGGSANNSGGGVYEIGVTRDVNGHINGFSGTATLHASSPFIDGGLDYGPADVLFYTRFPTNEIGQIELSSSMTDKVVDLDTTTPDPVTGSVGALKFVPAGQPGAGSLKIASFSNSTWYDADVAPDSTGTFDIINVNNIPGSTLSGGPEGIVYVNPGSPEFTNPSMLVSEFSAGRVSAYEIDVNGDPLPATRRNFITGLSGAEGAFIDPVTGDFLFSTFGGGNRVIVVQGFAEPPPPPPPTVEGRMVSNAKRGGARFASIVDCDAATANAKNRPFEIRWSGKRFSATLYSDVSCFDDPSFTPSPPPATTEFDTQTGTAAGTLNGSPGYYLEWRLEDHGAPSPADAARLLITRESDGMVIKDIPLGPLSSGQIYALPPADDDVS
jgi:hypothetical protein